MKNEKRPPIVTIMGHIDHGKTTLLDKIRKTHVVNQEYGGITQHIGAYQIEHQNKLITFIDTPGHVAFSKMRARGAMATDLVVLVIAANDGVMPQTRESLEHIRQAGTPFLIAINKTDLPQANPQMVKEQLQKEGILVEDLGGDIVCVEISAKTGQGINELLEMILLMAEMEELKADPKGKFRGIVIESSLNNQRGPLSTILVKNGTLKLGDKIKAKNSFCKVKAMFDENKKMVKTAGPSKPVEVLGFKSMPKVGSIVENADEKEKYNELETEKKAKSKLSLFPKNSNAPKLKIILKSDTQGTLEAIRNSLPKEVQVIFQAVGNINESDVFLSTTTGANIIGFNVKIPSVIKKLIKTEKVKAKSFNIIYELLDDIKKEATETAITETILGEAKIIAEFKMEKNRIAGCRVIKGKITKNDRLRIKRKEKILGEAKIKSMKRKKEKISEAQPGEEFGAIFSSPFDFQVGDDIIAYKTNQEK